LAFVRCKSDWEKKRGFCAGLIILEGKERPPKKTGTAANAMAGVDRGENQAAEAIRREGGERGKACCLRKKPPVKADELGYGRRIVPNKNPSGRNKFLPIGIPWKKSKSVKMSLPEGKCMDRQEANLYSTILSGWIAGRKSI
jgi:hypothetical protein